MFGNEIGELTFHLDYDYLTSPLLARFTFGEKIQFFANAGPYFGYLLKHKITSEASGEHPKKVADLTDDFKRLDFGLTTGLGVNFPIQERLLLSLEVRNNLGLRNISKFPIVNDGSIKTNSTNLLFGIAYRIGNHKK